MPISRNEVNINSRGGTELSMGELESRLPPELLEKFQIIPSRFRGIEPGLIPIYWVHDTEGDPEMHHLLDGGWQKFKKIVFVSNWQMQRFVEVYKIPWSHCEVLPNAIDPFDLKKISASPTKDEPVRFIYHTTPHRGLNVLVGAFAELAKTENVHLDVYSSFSIYGWNERDEPYQELYSYIGAHPNMTYHGARPNEEIREALLRSHVFVYPCTWPETGCRALIEAMMAGLVCASTNYGCLYETAGDTAYTYQFNEDLGALAGRTLGVIKSVVTRFRDSRLDDARTVNALRAQSRFSWDVRGKQWTEFLERMLK